MVDVADFSAMFTSLRAVVDLTKLIVNAHDAAIRREKGFELQDQIIAAPDRIIAVQTAHTALIGRVGELEKEVADLRAWDAEKQKYKLTKLSQWTDVLGYMLKEQASAGEPAHFLCANCFEDRVKSILQPEDRMVPYAAVLFCPRCGTELYTRGRPPGGQASKRLLHRPH